MKTHRLLTALTLLSIMGGSSMMPAMAYNPRYNDYNRYYPRSYAQQHPYVQKAAIGGGAGALLGAILSPEGVRTDGAIKGALLGAGAGMGYEYLKRKGYIGSNW